MNRYLLGSAALLPTDSTVDVAEERFLSTADVARRWGRSIRTLEGWRLRRQGPPFVRLNRLIVYRLSDILAFEKAGRIDPRSPGSTGEPR